MRVGDLVAVTLHTNTTMLGLVEKINYDHADPVDSMFPYLVYFSNNDYNDWYGLSSIEVINAIG